MLVQTPCAAPATHLRFEVTGLVYACCRSTLPLGNIRTETIAQIWDGVRRHQLGAAVAAGDFSLGCQSCETEVRIEGREGSFLATFDAWGSPRPDDAAGRWPRRFELNLSNKCNLQCVQCDGDSSSAIRIHREGRPPLPAVYGDSFFDDLAEFVPHLDELMFGGGEPFLTPECFRAWDVVAAADPTTPCTIVTNATQWNARVEGVLDALAVTPVISLDAIRPATYEAIRVGADYEAVMANTARLARYAHDAGRQAYVNVCLMPQNHAELGELLLWADGHHLAANVLVVREPAHCSLARSSPAELRAALALLESQDGELRPQLSLNLAAWDAELARLRHWVGALEPQADRAESRAPSHTIMRFPCAGAGPTSDEDARAELAAGSADGVVHSITVDDTDHISGCGPSLTEQRHRLVGQPVSALETVFGEMLGGPMIDYRVERASDDQLDAVITFPHGVARTSAVALRGADGWASEVSFLVALQPA